MSISKLFLFLLLLLPLSARAEHFLTYIIPCYNCEKWVPEAIASIYHQHLRCPFEIVCTDDGSSDATFEVLSALSQKHPEIHLMRHGANQGGGATRNTCVQNSKGDIIFCLDSDNVLFPDTIQLLIDWMDETRSDVVSFGGVQYFSDGMHLHDMIQYTMPSDGYSLEDILQTVNSPPWSGNYLFTRASFDRVGGYPSHLNANDTFAFGFKQAASGCKMVFVPDVVYLHRIGFDGYYLRSAKTNRLQIGFFDLLLSYKELFSAETIRLLETHRQRAIDQLPYHHPVDFLYNKWITLNAQGLSGGSFQTCSERE